MVLLFDGNDCVKQKHKSCESSKPVFGNGEQMFVQVVGLLMCFGQVCLDDFCLMMRRLGVKKKNKPFTDLMKFTFFSA